MDRKVPVRHKLQLKKIIIVKIDFLIKKKKFKKNKFEEKKIKEQKDGWFNV